MLLALVAAAIQTAPTASDFFPMEAGMKWTYESSGDQSGMYEQAIGAPMAYAGKSLPPLLTISKGKVVAKTFYEATPSGLYILGQDPGTPFERPQPVYQFDPKGAKWTFDGPSPYEDDKGSGLRMTGESRLIGEREYLGAKYLCLEVKTDTRIGPTTQVSTQFKQTMTFAKGVGMVAMEQSAQFGKRTTKFKVKIVKFEKTGAMPQ